MPLLIIVGLGLIFTSRWQSHSPKAVLPYATSMSRSDLFSRTNIERSNNAQGALVLNDKLNQAAQAKAEDMAARNYWSHNTPEGQPPWIFIDSTGYEYQKAGENLAYGFLTSSDAVTGWMNSPSHKANLLDSAYGDVGFGFANAANYQSTGPETIVVAMYGQALGASTPAPTQALPESTPTASAPAPAIAPTESQSPTPVTEQSAPLSEAETPKKSEEQPVTTLHNPIEEAAAKNISRVAALTSGRTAWMASTASMLIVAGIGVLLVKHGLALRRLFTKGERFVLHHALFDITIVALLGLCFIITRTAVVVK